MTITPLIPDPRAIQESAARGDVWFPFAYIRPLPEANMQGPTLATQFIMHTEASGGRASNDASWRYWARDDIRSEAHFLLAMDPSTESLGALWQTIPINIRADNNVKSNDRAISIETQDWGGSTVDTTPWTDFQIRWLGALLAWLHLNPRSEVPMHLVGPKWSDPGYAPHNLFPNDWSTSGHSCPGKARTKQIPDVAAYAQSIIDWHPAPTPSPLPPPEDDMSRNVRINLTSGPEKRPIFGELWCQGAPLNSAGEPVVLDVEYGGPGGPEYDAFLAAHRASGVLLEKTYDISLAKGWVFHGSVEELDSADISWNWTKETFHKVVDS